MTAYVVLLRAINVGGHNKVPMAELRTMMADLEFGDVTTLLQTGNIVCGSDEAPAALTAIVHAGIADRFGHNIEVMVRTADELSTIVRHFPFDGADPKQSGVVFLDGSPTEPLDASAFAPDQCSVADDNVYVDCPTSFAKTKLSAAWIEKRTGLSATRRNWNTVLKLAELSAG